MFLFDDRSARTTRLTGWERYTAAVLPGIVADPRFTTMGVDVTTTADRLRSDWIDLPRSASSTSGTLMPTFPPTPRMDPARVVWVLHDLTWLHFPQWASRLGRYYYRPLARRALAEVAHVITVSDTVRRELIALGLPSHRITRVYPGRPSVVPQSHQVAPMIPVDRPYALAVGSLDPRKNLELLYRCWAHTDVDQRLQLVVAGRRAWGNDTPDWVTFVDTPSDEELAWLYSHCAVFVQPSHYEGFGLPVIEADAYGARIACSDIPVFREVAPASATLFRPTEVESLRAAIYGALDRPASEPPQRTTCTWAETAASLASICQETLR